MKGLLVSARPRQWIKNLLVLAAPGAAGVLAEPFALRRAAIAFVAFCAAASGTYLINDARDHHADRLHPDKRHRPVAAGQVTPRVAVMVGAAALTVALAVATLLAPWRFGVVIGAYIVVTLAYTMWLKHVPVVDLAAVSSGFVLRAIGGAVAVGVPLSSWFLIVASFGSLFMVTGKRSAELGLGDGSADHRPALAGYSEPYLRYVRGVASTVAVLAYCLWAFEKAELGGAIWYELSIVPFVVAILLYALALDRGAGGAPEDIVLRDRALQLTAVVWLVTFLAGVYVT